jgi:hypothetical protein
MACGFPVSGGIVSLPLHRRVLAIAGVAAFAGVAVTAAQQAQQQEPPMPAVERGTLGPEAFNGLWDYNDVDSVNAATGRPEQAPRSATSRSPGSMNPGQVRVRNGPGRGGDPGAGYTQSSRVGSRGYRNTPSGTAYLVRKAEDFLRDLLEVPESYAIEVTGGSVTFTDDLERQHTYPTDGENRDYQLSASRFEAKAWWDGGMLTKEIKGGGGYTMTEQYFLSVDGSRLYVIVRVKGNRAAYVAAFNRVYDRIE